MSDAPVISLGGGGRGKTKRYSESSSGSGSESGDDESGSGGNGGGAAGGLTLDLGGSSEMHPDIQPIDVVEFDPPPVTMPKKTSLMARRGKNLTLTAGDAPGGLGGGDSADDADVAPAFADAASLISASGAFEIGTFRITADGMSGQQPRGDSDETNLHGLPTLRKEDIEVLSSLGSGSQGFVDKVVHRPTGLIMARKTIRVDMTQSGDAEKKRDQLFAEVKTYSESITPNVVQSLGCYFEEGLITILLEFMDCGSLEHVIARAGGLPEPAIALIGAQILRGIQYLHETRHLVHRDIKPANILLSTDGVAKITDFGVSKEVANTIAGCETFVGTFTYMAPERIDTTRAPGGYNFSVDVWAIGLMLVECAMGRYPYPDDVVNQMFAYMSKVCEEKPAVDEWLPDPEFSAEFRDFVAQAMANDPADRPTASELLQHPFITTAEESKFDLAEFLRDIMIWGDGAGASGADGGGGEGGSTAGGQ